MPNNINLEDQLVKRVSSCSDMLEGNLLFQINEKKKYIGFLEESDDEEKSDSDKVSDPDLIYHEYENEEDSINKFLKKIDHL